MHEADFSQTGPDLPVSFRLQGEPAVLVEKSNAGDALRAEVERGIAGLLAQLGIPGAPKVEIEIHSDASESQALPLVLRVNGRPAGYPSSLLAQLASYLMGIPQAPGKAGLQFDASAADR